jgi:hypothetical protein
VEVQSRRSNRCRTRRGGLKIASEAASGCDVTMSGWSTIGDQHSQRHRRTDSLVYAEIAPFGQESTQVPHSEQSSARASTAVSPKSRQPFGQLSTQVPHALHESRSIVGLAMSHSLPTVMHSAVCAAQQ